MLPSEADVTHLYDDVRGDVTHLYDDVGGEDARRVLVDVTVEVLVAHPEADRHLILHVQHTRVRTVTGVYLKQQTVDGNHNALAAVDLRTLYVILICATALRNYLSFKLREAQVGT